MIKVKKIFISLLFFLSICIPKLNAEITDGIFVTVGNRAITQSDVINEIKTILILNNMSYSEDKREDLQQMAVKSLIKKNVKEIEINKHNFLEYNKDDFNGELLRLAGKINMDIETMKNIFMSNGLDFSIVQEQIKTELLWNSLIFYAYRDKVSINLEEIDEQLRTAQTRTNFEEFLISELVIEPVEENKLNSRLLEVKNGIENEGFENFAIKNSISETAIKGGDLGWVTENEISKKFRSIIVNTPIGSLSKPIFLKDGILIFKVRDKKESEKELDLEELKNQLIKAEKSKILNMYSMSHYDRLRRSVSVKYFDE